MELGKDGRLPDFTDEQYLLCSPIVSGFALNEKKWGYFHLDLVEAIEFDENVFRSSLILDPKVKDMILSLVDIHEDERLQFDDVIQGKGKGMIFLLHGESGVGKTLTAGTYIFAP